MYSINFTIGIQEDCQRVLIVCLKKYQIVDAKNLLKVSRKNSVFNIEVIKTITRFLSSKI